MKSDQNDKPARRHPQGKRWANDGIPAGPAAYGLTPRPATPEEAGQTDGAPATPGEAKSSNTELEFPERTALALREEFGSELIQIIHFRGEWTAVMKPERILEYMKYLRDTWNYAMCHDVTSVDLFPEEPRFMTVYHLLNLEQAVRFRVKCPVAGENPEIDSVVPIWVGADFTEREVFDLMGIRFRGHPDLRRILLTDDYEGHPLRKDYPLTGFDMGIDTLKD